MADIIVWCIYMTGAVFALSITVLVCKFVLFDLPRQLYRKIRGTERRNTRP